MSCADCGNFLCKKFHKTSHTLHSLITRKFNEPHERSAKLSSENAGCLQDFSDDTESRLTRMWFKNYETMTVFVVCFTNELLFIPLSWQFDSVICCLIDSGSQSGVTVQNVGHLTHFPKIEFPFVFFKFNWFWSFLQMSDDMILPMRSLNFSAYFCAFASALSWCLISRNLAL